MKRQLLSITAAFTLVFSLSQAARALPGETVQTVKNRVAKQSMMSPLKRGIAELSGLPFYTSEGKLPSGTIVFSMSPDRQDQRSQQETIALGTAQSFKGFTRENLGLIQQMFNTAVSEDFRRSQYVARVDYAGIEKRFYRGRTFAYRTTEFKQPNQGRKFYHFTVLTLKDLNGEIQGERQCRQQSPYGCE